MKIEQGCTSKMGPEIRWVILSLICFCGGHRLFAEGTHAKDAKPAGSTGNTWIGDWGLNRVVRSSPYGQYTGVSAEIVVSQLTCSPYNAVRLPNLDAAGNVEWTEGSNVNGSHDDLFDSKPTAYLGCTSFISTDAYDNSPNKTGGVEADVGLQIEWAKENTSNEIPPGWSMIVRAGQRFVNPSIWTGTELVPWRMGDLVNVVGPKANFKADFVLNFQVDSEGAISIETPAFDQNCYGNGLKTATVYSTLRKPYAGAPAVSRKCYMSTVQKIIIDPIAWPANPVLPKDTYVIYTPAEKAALLQQYGGNVAPAGFIEAYPGDVFPDIHMKLNAAVPFDKKAGAPYPLVMKHAVGITQVGDDFGTRSGLDGSTMTCEVKNVKLYSPTTEADWNDTAQVTTGHDGWLDTPSEPDSATGKLDASDSLNQPPPFGLDARWSLNGLNSNFSREYETSRSDFVLNFPGQGFNARKGIGAGLIQNGGDGNRYTDEVVATSLRRAARVMGSSSALSYVPFSP